MHTGKRICTCQYVSTSSALNSYTRCMQHLYWVVIQLDYYTCMQHLHWVVIQLDYYTCMQHLHWVVIQLDYYTCMQHLHWVVIQLDYYTCMQHLHWVVIQLDYYTCTKGSNIIFQLNLYNPIIGCMPYKIKNTNMHVVIMVNQRDCCVSAFQWLHKCSYSLVFEG